jgi:transposase
MTGATFEAYVEQILLPSLRKGDVVVIDNLKAHQGHEIRRLIEGVGATLLHLPPYSPDLSPIESMFSKFKEYLRRIGARTRDELYQAMRDGLDTMTLQDILGWFENSGLCARQT